MPESRKNGKYWVDKEEFYNAIVEHHKKQAENPDKTLKLSNYIAQCITNISVGVMSRYNFNRYPFRDEMISDAILTILKYFNTFKPEKSNNPHGYFWLAAYRSGQRRVILENEQKAIKAKTIQNMLIDDDIMSDDEMGEFKDYMSDFYEFDVDAYEEKKFGGKGKSTKGHYQVTTKKERDARKNDSKT